MYVTNIHKKSKNIVKGLRNVNLLIIIFYTYFFSFINGTEKEEKVYVVQIIYYSAFTHIESPQNKHMH